MIPDRYNKDNLVRAIRDPSMLIDEGRRIISKDKMRNVAHLPHKLRFKIKNGSGVNIMERDWDYLLILDACRYDIFQKYSEIDGDLRAVISKGSHSVEFCEGNFAGEEFHDTVYVTANGYGAKIGKNTFHDLIFTDEEYVDSEVDVLHSIQKGISPSTVYKAAQEAYYKYPNKRMIVHFMQPHDPYLGPKAEELRKELESVGVVISSRNPEKINRYDSDKESFFNSLAAATREGYLDISELEEVYIENLNLVLDYIELFLENVNGKVVITADHGELLGEYDTIGHPRNRYHKELRKVPWLEVNNGRRPDIIEENPVEQEPVDENSIEERLETLGYK